jgi:hypothetical protein
MVVSKLLATVGRETEKIRLEVPAKKLPSAALMSSNQLVRGSMRCCVEVAGENPRRQTRSRFQTAPSIPFVLPVFFYQLDAKLKRGFEFWRGDFKLFVSTCAQIVHSLQPYSLSAGDEIMIDSRDEQRRQRLRRPGRNPQASFKPIFDSLIAQRNHVTGRKIARRPTAESPAQRANRPTFGRMMPFDFLFLGKISEYLLSFERHDDLPGFVILYHEVSSAAQRPKQLELSHHRPRVRGVRSILSETLPSACSPSPR